MAEQGAPDSYGRRVRVVIRTPRVEDAEALGRVHVRAWQAAYRDGLMPDEYLASLSSQERASMWRDGLANPPRQRASRFVAVADAVVVGFSDVGPAGGDDTAEVGELYAINVDPDYWGTGVGSALIEAGLAALRDHGFTTAILWVHPDNARACRFYVARGWSNEPVKRRQDVLGVEVPETQFSIVLTLGTAS